MAEAYFSTQASVQIKADALVLQWWLDEDQDGSIDADAFDAARQEAKDEILSYVEPRYGSTICDAWNTDTRPEWVGTVSDWLTLYHSLSGNNAAHPVAVRRYEETIAKLEKVATYTLMIPGIDYVSGQQNETARVQYLDCTEAEAEAGDCDPCAYEYL